MIYHQLFQRAAARAPVRTGIIGTGHYATAVVTQSRAIPQLDVRVVADIDVAAARRAYALAGFPETEVAVCDSLPAARRALDLGKRVVIEDALLMMDLPIDVVVEATGVAEAGARHAARAIEHSKHVVMVGKEADCAVGPMLKRMADRAGVVYTPADGDQHGLLIGLVSWARDLGLRVLCGGKARDSGFVLNKDAQTLDVGRERRNLSAEAMALFDAPLVGRAADVVESRRRFLGDLGRMRGWDVAEMTIAANATGLRPDVPETHCPVVRVTEIPDVLCPRDQGGILAQEGAIDAVSEFGLPREAGLGGGVFVVVGCDNDYSRKILAEKGCIANRRKSTILITRPHHLCGVETPISILCAGLLGVGTGSADYRPRYDAVLRSRVALRAGARLGGDHLDDYDLLTMPAQPLAASSRLPFYLGTGQTLTADVPAGTIVTTDRIEEPAGSVLWALRRQQDAQFRA